MSENVEYTSRQRGVQKNVLLNDAFRIADFAPVLELLPSKPRLITSLNLFETQFNTSTSIIAERIQDISGVINGQQRGGERNFVGSESANMRPFVIPFFPLDRAIKSQDVQDFRLYGTPNTPRRTRDVVERVVARINNYHQQTKEKIFAEALMGRSFSGNQAGAEIYDYYNAWGQTQLQVTVNLVDPNVNPARLIENTARAHIIDSRGDGSSTTDIIALCSRKFFDGFINNSWILQAYQIFPQTNNILRDRLDSNANAKTFEHQGVLYIEDTNNTIPDGEAYVLPLGIDGMFQAHYAPADHYEYANTVAQEQYIWMNQIGRQYVIESEFSLLGVNTRPELVVKLVGVFE